MTLDASVVPEARKATQEISIAIPSARSCTASIGMIGPAIKFSVVYINTSIREVC